jgi:hypothetical protein
MTDLDGFDKMDAKRINHNFCRNYGLKYIGIHAGSQAGLVPYAFLQWKANNT